MNDPGTPGKVELPDINQGSNLQFSNQKVEKSERLKTVNWHRVLLPHRPCCLDRCLGLGPGLEPQN